MSWRVVIAGRQQGPGQLDPVVGEDLAPARQVRGTPRQGRVVVVSEDRLEDVVVGGVEDRLGV